MIRSEPRVFVDELFDGNNFTEIVVFMKTPVQSFSKHGELALETFAGTAKEFISHEMQCCT